MATASSRASKLTTLVLGQVQVPIGLFPTQAKPSKLAEFDTAGPNGGVLMAQMHAKPTPAAEQPVEQPDEPVRSDPFSDDLFAAGPAKVDEAATAAQGTSWAEGVSEAVGAMVAAAQVSGEYGRELVEQGTGEVVEPQNVRRGVRLEDGRFIDCTEQLAAITERTQIENMRIVSFVDITRVPRAHVVNAYYVGIAEPEAAKPLRLIFEGLRRRRRGAVVKFTKGSRQTRGVIGWSGASLMFYELVWAEDFREAPARALAIQKATVAEAEVEQVCRLIDAMAGTVYDLDALRDDAIALREELRARAEAGEIAEVVEPLAVGEPEQDLADALERSLAMVGSA